MFAKKTPNSFSSNEKPKDWLAESIIVTIFFCVPIGIVAIVYAVKVNKLYDRGERTAAHIAARKAGLWTKIGFITGSVFLIWYFTWGNKLFAELVGQIYLNSR